jgi:glutaredoxin 3
MAPPHADIPYSALESCTKAKRFVNGLDLGDSAVGIIELDEMGEEGAAIQDYLQKKTGQRTVPNVWIKQQFIGG